MISGCLRISYKLYSNSFNSTCDPQLKIPVSSIIDLCDQWELYLFICSKGSPVFPLFHSSSPALHHLFQRPLLDILMHVLTANPLANYVSVNANLDSIQCQHQCQSITPIHPQRKCDNGIQMYSLLTAPVFMIRYHSVHYETPINIFIRPPTIDEEIFREI